MNPKLREALEAALVEDPDDIATHAAYADLLSEEGDPRGEFIQVQLALEDETVPPQRRKQLQEREEQLYDAHHRKWLGELASLEVETEYDDDPLSFNFDFRRGWIDTLEIDGSVTPSHTRIIARAPQLQ